VRCTGSAIVELNRAVAVAEAHGAAAALAIVEALAPSLDEYQYLHSSRAEIFRLAVGVGGPALAGQPGLSEL
jgi:RNA polymerase sigma-70 factor (ECF subfamily)